MKRKTFLFAAILPCIVFAISAALAFKPESGKPVIETSSLVEDSSWYYEPLEADLDELAYDTWLNDGSPSDDLKEASTNHYCCKTSPAFVNRRDRLDWVTTQMGPGNSNHVHHIEWILVDGASGDCPLMGGYCCCYRARVKIWTSEACTELCP